MTEPTANPKTKLEPTTAQLLAPPVRFSLPLLALNLVVLAVLYYFDDALMPHAQSGLRQVGSNLIGWTRAFGEFPMLVAILIAIVLLRAPQRKLIPMFFVGVLGATIVVSVLKPTVGRLRPNHSGQETIYMPMTVRERGLSDATLIPEGASSSVETERTPIPGTNREVISTGSPSFPSGHATMAMSNAALLGYAFPPLRPLVVTIAVGTGCTRIRDNNHFPSDVWAGFLVGHYGALVVVFFWRRRVLSRNQLVDGTQ